MAQASEMKFGSNDPRVCCICARPVRLSHPGALRFYHAPGVHLAWHVDCETPGWAHLHTATVEETG